jgi:hypothetical protein
VPAIIADLGDQAGWRLSNFSRQTFAIRAGPTPRRATSSWAGATSAAPALSAIWPHDVATYIERLQNEASAPLVKQQLAAVRMLFDWLRPNRPGQSRLSSTRTEACAEDRRDAGARYRGMEQAAR